MGQDLQTASVILPGWKWSGPAALEEFKPLQPPWPLELRSPPLFLATFIFFFQVGSEKRDGAIEQLPHKPPESISHGLGVGKSQDQGAGGRFSVWKRQFSWSTDNHLVDCVFFTG